MRLSRRRKRIAKAELVGIFDLRSPRWFWRKLRAVMQHESSPNGWTYPLLHPSHAWEKP